MTKQERLHWLYTALLVVFIGTIIATVSINIAIRVSVSQAEKNSRNYVDHKIQLYDSTVTKINVARYDTIIYQLKELRTTLNGN